MPYAIFSGDQKISKAFPSEADVWRHAEENGLVVDAASDEEGPQPKPALDKDYEIRRCQAANEDPRRNEIEAEKAAAEAPYLKA